MNKFLYNICPLLAILCYSISDVIHQNILVVLGFLLILPYTIRHVLYGEHKELRTFMIIVLVASVLNLLTTNNGIGGSVIFIGSCGITAFCIDKQRESQFITVGLIAFMLWFLYTRIFIIGMRVDDIFEPYGLSKNYPGCLLVLLCCFWGFLKYNYYKKLPLILPIVSMIMAFFLDGRSSLVCLAILVLFCLAVRGGKYMFLTIAVTVAVLYYFWPTILTYYELSSLSSKGMDSDRYNIWSSYFNNLDFPSFLFGLETRDLPHLRDYGGNPHNSLLNFHYRMGIIGVVALVYYLAKSWCLLLKRHQFVLLFFSLVLWVRMFTDTCLVCATDFIVYSMLFFPFIKYSRFSSFENKNYVINKNNDRQHLSLIDKILLIL